MERSDLKYLGLGFALGLALFVTTVDAAKRPVLDHTPEGDLVFNGSVTRELNGTGGGLADAGGLSMITLDAGIGCNTLLTGSAYELHCDTDGHFCPWGDGGCSKVIGSQAFGKPFAKSTAAAPAPLKFWLPSDTVNARRLVCVTPATTANMTCAALQLN